MVLRSFFLSLLRTKALKMNKYQQRFKTPQQRFDEKVNQSPGLGPNGDCWEWQAFINPSSGYGVFRMEKQQMGAHRASYLLHTGPIPDGMVVRHRCDNPICVNPAHLLVGTDFDNMRDMALRGRGWQQLKTHCPKGHEYTPENTYIQPSKPNFRFCRICKKAANDHHNALKKGT